MVPPWVPPTAVREGGGGAYEVSLPLCFQGCQLSCTLLLAQHSGRLLDALEVPQADDEGWWWLLCRDTARGGHRAEQSVLLRVLHPPLPPPPPPPNPPPNLPGVPMALWCHFSAVTSLSRAEGGGSRAMGGPPTLCRAPHTAPKELRANPAPQLPPGGGGRGEEASWDVPPKHGASSRGIGDCSSVGWNEFGVGGGHSSAPQ